MTTETLGSTDAVRDGVVDALVLTCDIYSPNLRLKHSPSKAYSTKQKVVLLTRLQNHDVWSAAEKTLINCRVLDLLHTLQAPRCSMSQAATQVTDHVRRV
jgi:hypothetical protein